MLYKRRQEKARAEFYQRLRNTAYYVFANGLVSGFVAGTAHLLVVNLLYKKFSD